MQPPARMGQEQLLGFPLTQVSQRQWQQQRQVGHLFLCPEATPVGEGERRMGEEGRNMGEEGRNTGEERGPEWGGVGLGKEAIPT